MPSSIKVKNVVSEESQTPKKQNLFHDSLQGNKNAAPFSRLKTKFI